jgi:manganese transport protein
MTHLNLLESKGWKRETSGKSLEEVHKSVPVPKGLSWFWKLLAFSGPGYLVAVGYMDPGNWATDLAGGAKFGYALLSVILISNLFAVLLQHLAAKLGIATGKDLAQACRASFSRPVNIMLWIMAEIMITACDLAEVIGSAIALNLLFHIPLLWGVVITAADVLMLLFLQHRGFRWLEALVITLITTVVVCFAVDLAFAHPAMHAVLKGFIPTAEIFKNSEMLYIAIGILGATVMPHNLYLHSSVVQTRAYEETPEGKREAITFMTVDSTLALTFAFFVNAAILIMSAAVFNVHGLPGVAELGEAYRLLTPILGTSLAAILFGVALLASGQNSTITGTLAGQIIMEGFISVKLRPWLRRLVTRLLAIVPAVIVVFLYGGNGLTKLLILSQVILSIQLPFAVFPLVAFTSNRAKMGEFVNPAWIKTLAIAIAAVITGLNGWLIWSLVA